MESFRFLFEVDCDDEMAKGVADDNLCFLVVDTARKTAGERAADATGPTAEDDADGTEEEEAAAAADGMWYISRVGS